MKRIFLATGILMVAATTFANTNIDRKSKMEKREERKEHRMERRVENKFEVNNLTKNQFETDFPGARNISYSRINDFDKISFNTKRRALTAYYDYNSELVGTTQAKTFADLPENAQKDIRKKYSDYNITGVIEYRDNEDNSTNMILYNLPLEDSDNYFVELNNGQKSLVLKVDLPGYVSFFKEIQ
jgi:hypothetical protein